MTKVSVVVPVYNVEEYLRDCLDSIRAQTLKNIEIICIDDGSLDSSGKILDEYAQKDKRFHVIHKENEGYGKAMNVGIRMATSPYIGIVESDDMILPHMYESLLSLIEETRAEVLKADFYEFYMSENGEKIEKYVPLADGQSLVDLYETCFNITEHEEAFLFNKHTWTGLYSRAFLEREHIEHNKTPGASHQDAGFWFQTLIKAKSIYFVKDAFYCYRIDNPNCSMHNSSKPFAICNEYDFIDSILRKMGNAGERFYKWLNYMRTIEGINSITRMADEYKIVLAERIKKDFLEALQKGHIAPDLYNPFWKEKIFDLISSPESYVEKEKARRRRIENAIGDHEMVILYGAGEIGRRALHLLREGRLNTRIKFFAVTRTEGNPELVEGIPVRAIDDLKKYKEKALVIISVGKKYIQEVEDILKVQEFQHCINIGEIMQEQVV